MEVLEALREASRQVLAGQPVLFAYLFGSHARGDADRHSDLDVAVFLEESVPPEDYLDLALGLAGELERVAGRGPVEALVVLNETPLPVAGRVIREGKLLYSRDEPQRVVYESRIFRESVDFELWARGLEEELLRAHAEGRR